MSNDFFMANLVNGRTGDPALHVDLSGLGRSVLFDAGALDRLNPARILRTTHVFVSHAHIDHFIGFDHFLRVVLGHPGEIRLFGPEGFLSNVEGKLAGYTWNLVEGSELSFIATEILPDRLRTMHYRCGDGFSGSGLPVESRAAGTLPALQDGTAASCAILDHGIPSIAYSLREPDRLNIDAEALRAAGLEPGPWLAQLKDAVRRGAPASTVLEAGGREFELGNVAGSLIVRTRGDKITYVADCAPTAENEAAIVGLAGGSDILFCEGAYLDEDAGKAAANRHLTAGAAGRIARAAGAARLEVFHFSPRYLNRFADLEREAAEAFTFPGRR